MTYRPRRQRRIKPLRRAVNMPIWANVGLRLGAAIILIMLVVLIHWFERDGLMDHHDGHVSFLDVVYFTMISVTTTGYGDITPISNRARLMETLVITPIRITILFIFIGTAYKFMIKRTWESWHMTRIQKKLADHIVVLGFGMSGLQAVSELLERNFDPAQILVMDPDPKRLKLAERIGCTVMEGDASRNDILLALKIDKAQNVLVSAGRDDTSILIVLTVRHLAPYVPISVVVRAADNEVLAHQAGATNVINPVRFTGLLLAGSAHGSHITDYLSDLASITGRVQLVERPAMAEEIGRSLNNLASGGRGLRIYRNGQPIGFWEAAAQNIEASDTIVEIMPVAKPEG